MWFAARETSRAFARSRSLSRYALKSSTCEQVYTSLDTLRWCADNRFIMVIEMSGLQFRPKSYMWFLKCALIRFDITNVISDQNCMIQSLITTSLHPLWNHRIPSVPIFHRSSSWFVEKQKHKEAFTISILYSKQKWCKKGQKWCDLVRTEMMQFRT